MSDPVESMLEGLSAARDATRPAPAFLRAVARRRHRRQLTQAGIGAAVLLAAVGLWQLVPSPLPQRDGVIASATFALPEASLAALTRANTGTDGESLRLPEPEGSGPAQELRLGMRGDRLEQWLSQ